MSSSKFQKLMLSLAVIAGTSAMTVNASASTISLSLADQTKLAQVMAAANELGFDYTIRPKLSADGQFEAGVVEISIQDRVQFAAVRRMVAN